MAFNRPFPKLLMCSRLSYVVSFSNYHVYLCETDIFSFRIKAENLSHVTTFELPSSYASQLSYASFCGNGNLLQLIFSDCQMLFWVAYEGIIMTLKSTDMTNINCLLGQEKFTVQCNLFHSSYRVASQFAK